MSIKQDVTTTGLPNYRVCQGSWPLWISKVSKVCKWNTFFVSFIKHSILLVGIMPRCDFVLCLCFNFFDLSTAELFFQSQRSLKIMGLLFLFMKVRIPGTPGISQCVFKKLILVLWTKVCGKNESWTLSLNCCRWSD